MSDEDYLIGLQISAEDHPFYALIHAAMRKADSDNLEKLKESWPEVWDELERLYHTPGVIC